jgi:hypothetical protein
MSAESRHKGVVIATDHFVDRSGEMSVLSHVLSDKRLSDRVTGLWVPKSIIDDDNCASTISQVAQGAPTQFSMRYSSPDKVPNFRLIYDTSSSGGVPDTLEHLKHITHYYPAPHMTFTVNVSAFAEVLDATEKFRKHEYEKHGRAVDFLLATAYPENDLHRLRQFTKMDADEYTSHVSDLANEYEMAGVVGAGDLARFTIVGQYFLALGVCINGAEDYTVETKPWGAKVKKRMFTPEQTYQYATNTEVQLSRTLFDDGHGNLEFPNSQKQTPETLDRISELVKSNFFSVVDRLDNLLEPTPLAK